MSFCHLIILFLFFKNYCFSYHILNVSVNGHAPFCAIKKLENGQLQIEHNYYIETNLLQLLEKRFQFKANLIDANENWNIDYKNGTWHGIIGHVFSKVMF